MGGKNIIDATKLAQKSAIFVKLGYQQPLLSWPYIAKEKRIGRF